MRYARPVAVLEGLPWVFAVCLSMFGLFVFEAVTSQYKRYSFVTILWLDMLEISAIIEGMVNNHKCVMCGRFFSSSNTPRRPRLFCSDACRQRHYRRWLQVPDSMRGMVRWTRADGKRPVMPDGSPASSTNPSTWRTFRACLHGAGDGLGIMMGDGLAVYDLDHCLSDGSVVSDAAGRLLDSLDRSDVIFSEVSQSGTGLHVFVRSDETHGWRRGGVEFYPRARFVRMTGLGWSAW